MKINEIERNIKWNEECVQKRILIANGSIAMKYDLYTILYDFHIYYLTYMLYDSV